MPKLKNYGKGKRFNIWIPERCMKTWSEIENHSKFVQMALEQAVGVMQWAIMKEKRPDLYYEAGRLEDVIDDFNQKFPLDPVTKKRMENERVKRTDPGANPQPNKELW